MTRLVAMLSIVFALAGCGPSLLHVPAPEVAFEQAQVADFPSSVRFWGDAAPEGLEKFALLKAAQIKAHPRKSSEWDMLAISGGGADGAFGAGLLVGWSKTGKRPTFELVTGTSTGAIIAPFAFLGSKYDRQLKEIYTTISTDDVIKGNVLSALFGGTSLADTSGFEQLVARYTSQEMLDEIGTEYNKGRFLLIATTNIDAQRPVLWNIGAIATSGNSGSLALFRKIILASAAIPGAFPPVSLDVTLDGKTYNELHVDGGVTAQVSLYPPQTSPRDIDKILGIMPKRRLFVIRNSKVNPEYAPVKAGLYSISKRSFDTLIKSQGVGDLYRLYTLAQRDQMEYNLAFIPDGFNAKSDELFDLEYMRALFKSGYDLGSKGYRWVKSPALISDKPAWIKKAADSEPVQ